MGQKRYRVSGLDEHGDVHALVTDNRESAEGMLKIMGEDWQEVELLTSEAPAPSSRISLAAHASGSW